MHLKTLALLIVSSVVLCSCGSKTPGDGYYYPVHINDGEYSIIEYDFNDQTPIEYSKGYDLMYTILGFNIKKNVLVTYMVAPIVDEDNITYKYSEDQKYELEYFDETISVKTWCEKKDDYLHDVFYKSTFIYYTKGRISINREGNFVDYVTKSFAKNNKYTIVKF